jgi:hypothetical protein
MFSYTSNPVEAAAMNMLLALHPALVDAAGSSDR